MVTTRARVAGLMLTCLMTATSLAACGGAGTTQQPNRHAEVPDVLFEGSPESGLPTAYPEPKRDALRIGLLNPSRSTEVLATMYDAAAAEVERFGGEAIELDAALNPDLQVNQFQRLLNQGVDAIGMVPIADPQLLGPLLEQAHDAGVPVVGLEVTPAMPGPVPGFATQVSQGRDHMVYLQIKAAAEELGPGAKVGLIGIALPIPLFEFAAERQRYWADKFGLEIVDEAKSANDTTEGGQQAATGLIARNPDLEGIIGYNDEPAIGAALAARGAGRPDIKTFGVLAGSLGKTAIRSGRLTASVYFDPSAEGRILAQGLLNVAQGQEVPPVVLTDAVPFIVTKQTVDEE